MDEGALEVVPASARSLTAGHAARHSASAACEWCLEARLGGGERDQAAWGRSLIGDGPLRPLILRLTSLGHSHKRLLLYTGAR